MERKGEGERGRDGILVSVPKVRDQGRIALQPKTNKDFKELLSLFKIWEKTTLHELSPYLHYYAEKNVIEMEYKCSKRSSRTGDQRLLNLIDSKNNNLHQITEHAEATTHFIGINST